MIFDHDISGGQKPARLCGHFKDARTVRSLRILSFTLPMRIALETYAGLVVGGLLLGIFGSSIAMRRYLKV